MTGIFEDGAYGAEHPRIDVNGFHVKRSTPFTRSTPPMEGQSKKAMSVAAQA